MSAAFLAPIFLAGITLLAIPWLIHHIRRPPRDPVRFSSLLFLPEIKKEVIERRRIQHILLMLLRMLLLLLLVMAFSRPFSQSREHEVVAGSEPSHQVILVDTSYSMGLSPGIEAARRTALAALAQIPDHIPVAVMTFARSPVLISPFDGGARASHDRARRLLAEVQITEEVTDYAAALQSAENLILTAAPPGADELEEIGVLHMISDFRKQGLPEEQESWRLSGKIRFVGHEVSADETVNLSLTDIAVQGLDNGKLRISGKVKNWQVNADKTVEVSLFMENREITRKTVTVGAGNASQVSFLLNQPETTPQKGWLQIGDDGLALDNRRYFVWRQPRKLEILLVADPPQDKQWGAAFFLEKALLHSKQVPWILTRTTQTALPALLQQRQRPDLIIAGDLGDITAAGASSLLTYASEGGAILLMLNERTTPASLNQHLLPKLGLSDAGISYPDPSEVRFDILGWVDFDHPIFYVFRGARFNDFSQLRFMNYHRLTAERSDSSILARFSPVDNSKPPAIFEAGIGNGKLIIWTFSPQLAWTNLPKHVKFVPFLHETVQYLTGYDREEVIHSVGDTFRPGSGEGGGDWLALTPRGEQTLENDNAGLRLAGAGFIQLKQGDDENWRYTEAVNPQTHESDPELMGVRELSLKLTSNSSSNDEALEAMATTRDRTNRNEFGYLLIVCLCLFLLVETWYAPYLSKRAAMETT